MHHVAGDSNGTMTRAPSASAPERVAFPVASKAALIGGLKSIGWSTKGCSSFDETEGDYHYRRVINYKGEATGFMITRQSLNFEPWGEQRTSWGLKASEHGNAGAVSFEFSKCQIDVESDCVSVFVDGAHISFYNFEKPAATRSNAESPSGTAT